MREPSIHITESSLKYILSNILVEIDVDDKLVRSIVRESKKYTLINRSVSVTAKYLDKKVTSLLKVTSKDAHLMASLIKMKRQTMRFRGVYEIKEGSKDWSLLKSVTQLAIMFCKDYKLTQKAGFLEFLDIAISLDKDKSIKLTHIKSKYDNIYKTYGFKQKLLKDPTPSKTREIHDYYIHLVARQTGISDDYIDDIINYFYFYEVKLIVDKVKISFHDYIDAQFELLAWAKHFPAPHQLIGKESMKRLNKYLYTHGKSTGLLKEETKKVNKKRQNIWDSIKKLNPDTDGNDTD